MNISTGGPHILLFERDQQLITLLISEFQLAGYECHVARTAVEVFDAIARYPIRMVLVDLAQAAATRREFWVALDTQCRGRGVQVMTFQCTNIAGYGPHDPDDRTYAMADMHVDGMLGLMNMVDAVRSRVPVMTASNTLPRISRTSPTMPSYTQASAATAAASSGNPMSRPTTTAESRSARVTASTYPPTAPLSAPSALSPSLSSQQTTIPTTASGAGSAGGQSGPPTARTDKIRAVLYPTPRSRAGQSNQLEGVTGEQMPPGSSAARMRVREQVESKEQSELTTEPGPPSNLSMLQQLASGQNIDGESSLAQLSRMVQESRHAISGEDYDPAARQTGGMPFDTASLAAFSATPTTSAQAIVQTPSTSPSSVHESFSAQPLRASPIEDRPLERVERNTSALPSALPPMDETHPANSSYTNYGYEQPPTLSAQNTHSPLASLSAATGVTGTTATRETGVSPQPIVPPQATSLAQTESIARPSVERRQDERAVDEQKVEQVDERESPAPVQQRQEREQLSQREESMAGSVEEVHPIQEQSAVNAQLAAVLQAAQTAQENPTDVTGEQARTAPMPSNATLLDIVQNLPPMPPPPQQQVLSGRATRSLSKVLLEGHLVPQNRLEVAQNIQRMLRGVDLNYQLGEILLMFKLLTPDQLLAASLVSYGLITTQQIASLGRIRQELHAMGLEYDLESLLVLFRILTPEQLREVRASWSS